MRSLVPRERNNFVWFLAFLHLYRFTNIKQIKGCGIWYFQQLQLHFLSSSSVLNYSASRVSFERSLTSGRGSWVQVVCVSVGVSDITN